MKYEGDHFLSGNDLQGWKLCQHVLLNWGVLVPFRHTPLHVPLQREEWWEFFVPADCTYAYEIKSYLEKETARWVREPAEMSKNIQEKDGFQKFPGSKVSVYIRDFKGLEPHMESEQLEKIVQEAGKLFMQMLNDLKNESKENS